MNEFFEEHDVITLRRDFPKFGLAKGDIGTVVFVLSPKDFIVEFCGEDVFHSVCEDFSIDDLELHSRS
jgi:hypothetical protein